MDTKTLLEKVSAKASVDIDSASEMLSAFSEVLREKCPEMVTVAVPGFGVFEPKKRLERINVHPSTGKRMLIPPKIVLTFKPSALLKQKLNKRK